MDLDDVLERTQWDLFWLPPGVRVVDRPEILYLAAPGARDGYLNTVLRVRADDARVPALIEEVGAAHERCSSRWMLTAKSRSEALVRALAAAGYTKTHAHHGYAIAVDAYAPRAVRGVTVRPIQTMDDLRAAVDVLARAFERPYSHDEASLAQQLRVCTAKDGRVHRFVAWDDATGAAIGTAGMNSFAAAGGGFGFFWGGCVVREARGRGAFSALVGARVLRARSLGLTHVGLYARHETSAPIVAAQGFERLGPMDYWER
jgi:GNAT superfamily N-acetyltransferase